MSRVAKKPINLPKGVELTQTAQDVSVKGAKGTLKRQIPASVQIKKEDNVITLIMSGEGDPQQLDALAGTTRAHLHNMVKGVSEGFERKLVLVGVGYRAQVQGHLLNLSLGFSHPVQYTAPEGITIQTPSATEIVVMGINKDVVGQVAADIRAYRPPEPYKGKGIRYADEQIQLKEGKKK